MTQLSDPHRSRVVLVGAGAYTQLQPLPTVADNLSGLSDVLTDARLWGLPPANCDVVADPTTPQEVGRALRPAARATGVGGLLLVYFAGHGVVDERTGELHLAVGQTDREAAYATAVPYEWIRRAVLESPASRRVVILDCCYAGRATSGMSDDLSAVADEVEIDRTCVLMATSPNRAALAPPDEKYTAFTGALVDVLRHGVPDGPDPLDVATVYDEVLRGMRRRGRPLPEMRARNGGEKVPLVRNAAGPARHPAPAPAPAVPAPFSHAGGVLVAGPAVSDPELRGATVAILAHSPTTGALGVQLHRRTSRSALDVFDEPTPDVLNLAPVFDGGPVRDVVILLAAPRAGVAEPAGFRPVRGGGLGTVGVPVDETAAAALSAACLFVGYLGWRPGQLEAELAAGELVVSGTSLDTWFWQQHGRH
ncbi:MAG TPA: YqgE/AlgH family protein [Planosporangium sp.]|nr:YqgE/AlgH family protein [Planosporangium sp.]